MLSSSVRGCASSLPPPATLEEHRSFVSYRQRGPDEETGISADLHDIKIIKKEGRLKGKWL